MQADAVLRSLYQLLSPPYFEDDEGRASSFQSEVNGFGTVSLDLDLALASAATDREDAVNAGPGEVESVCRSILILDWVRHFPPNKEVHLLCSAEAP